MDGTDRRTRAREAIKQVARSHQLPENLIVLSERWNTVAILGDSDVVARAATLADLARDNPLASFTRELEVSRTLAERGASAQVPIGDVSVVDGFPISLWERVDGEMGTASERAMVESLASIHRLATDITFDQPWFATVAEAIPADIRVLLDRSVLGTNDALSLSEMFLHALDQVVAADLSGGLVHGDAQRKNAMDIDGEAIWIDFEDCCIGPYAWDLACLTKNPNYDVNRVLDHYAEVSGTSRIPESVIEPLWTLRDLQALTWMLRIQDEREASFREGAQELLNKLSANATGG